MGFFDDALAATAPGATTTAHPAAPQNTTTAGTVLVDQAVDTPVLVTGEAASEPIAPIVSAPSTTGEEEIMFFDAPATDTTGGDREDTAISTPDTIESKVSLDLANLSDQVAIVEESAPTPAKVEVPDPISSSSVLDTPSSVVAEAGESHESILTASPSLTEAEDPAAILEQTVEALKRSEQALESQAAQLESQAQSYHEQATMLIDAEESAKSQAELLHKKADELETTIEGISKEQQKFSR